MSDAFDSRRKELEEAFFAQQNQKLIQHLKELKQQSLDKAAISEMTGIKEAAIIDQLVALKLNAETLAAFALFPLVEVAWADGVATPNEKRAVLDGMHQEGIAAGTPAHRLVESWLETQPPRSLHAAWQAYVAALVKTMPAAEKAKLKEQVLGQAHAVAEASGGILGMLPRVSKEEAAVLKELEKAFA